MDQGQLLEMLMRGQGPQAPAVNPMFRPVDHSNAPPLPDLAGGNWNQLPQGVKNLLGLQDTMAQADEQWAGMQPFLNAVADPNRGFGRGVKVGNLTGPFQPLGQGEQWVGGGPMPMLPETPGGQFGMLPNPFARGGEMREGDPMMSGLDAATKRLGQSGIRPNDIRLKAGGFTAPSGAAGHSPIVNWVDPAALEQIMRGKGAMPGGGFATPGHVPTGGNNDTGPGGDSAYLLMRQMGLPVEPNRKERNRITADHFRNQIMNRPISTGPEATGTGSMQSLLNARQMQQQRRFGGGAGAMGGMSPSSQMMQMALQYRDKTMFLGALQLAQQEQEGAYRNANMSQAERLAMAGEQGANTRHAAEMTIKEKEAAARLLAEQGDRTARGQGLDLQRSQLWQSAFQSALEEFRGLYDPVKAAIMARLRANEQVPGGGPAGGQGGAPPAPGNTPAPAGGGGQTSDEMAAADQFMKDVQSAFNSTGLESYQSVHNLMREKPDETMKAILDLPEYRGNKGLLDKDLIEWVRRTRGPGYILNGIFGGKSREEAENINWYIMEMLKKVRGRNDFSLDNYWHRAAQPTGALPLQ